MPMIDPWRGTNQGLAALGNTFDELNARRRQDIHDTLAMERDRRDAEKDALAIESGRMTLDEQKRKVDNLRAYDEARKAQVAGFDMAAVPAEVPNPDYRPPVSEGLKSTMTYAGEANEVTPAQPAQGLPTMAGSRPMNENEKLAAMAQLAFKHGDTETLSKIGQWVNITDKLKGSEYDRMNKALDAIEKAAIMGPQYQLSVAKQVTKELGAPQNVIDQMVVNPNMNGIATPIVNAEGKVIGNMIFTWKNGKRQDLFHPITDKTFDREKFSETIRHNKAMENKPTASGSPDDKEEKRKVKAHTEGRREVERAYGFSQFLPTAQDPKLLQKVNEGKARVEDIIDNYKDYGLTKEPTPGKAAEMAKTMIDNKYNKKPAAPAVEDNKTKSIRELLFGPGTK